MTKIFSNRSKTIYLTSKTPPFEEGSFNVILSPEFYWVKKVKLPVNKISAARKLAQSVFEGNLPDGDYVYDVSKDGEEFIVIAYDKAKIKDILTSKFIKGAKVDGIYFAQNEFKDLEDCCGIDEYSSLINLNSLIMQVPRVCTESKREVSQYLKDKRLSRKKVSLSLLGSSVINMKDFYILFGGISLFVVAFGLDWLNYKLAIKNLEKTKQEIIEKNHFPKTSIQLESIKNSLTKRFKNQKKLRDIVFAFNSINLEDKEHIESINIDKKESVIVIKVSKPSRKSSIVSQLSKKVKILNTSIDNNTLTIRISS